MFEGVSKKDWKLFQEKVPEWQERYMGKLIWEYMAHMQGEGNPSGKFWWLEERIRKDKKMPGVQLTLDKWNVPYDLRKLILTGAITSLDDLEGFSDNLVEYVMNLVWDVTKRGTPGSRMVRAWRKKHPLPKE